jgi:hypothetical protein
VEKPYKCRIMTSNGRFWLFNAQVDGVAVDYHSGTIVKVTARI